MPKKWKIGQMVVFRGRERDVKCVVVEVGDDGRIVKARATKKDKSLLRKGFFEEGGEYVCIEYNLYTN